MTDVRPEVLSALLARLQQGQQQQPVTWVLALKSRYMGFSDVRTREAWQLYSSEQFNPVLLRWCKIITLIHTVIIARMTWAGNSVAAYLMCLAAVPYILAMTAAAQSPSGRVTHSWFLWANIFRSTIGLATCLTPATLPTTLRNWVELHLEYPILLLCSIMEPMSCWSLLTLLAVDTTACHLCYLHVGSPWPLTRALVLGLARLATATAQEVWRLRSFMSEQHMAAQLSALTALTSTHYSDAASESHYSSSSSKASTLPNSRSASSNLEPARATSLPSLGEYPTSNPSTSQLRASGVAGPHAAGSARAPSSCGLSSGLLRMLSGSTWVRDSHGSSSGRSGTSSDRWRRLRMGLPAPSTAAAAVGDRCSLSGQLHRWSSVGQTAVGQTAVGQTRLAGGMYRDPLEAQMSSNWDLCVSGLEEDDDGEDRHPGRVMMGAVGGLLVDDEGRDNVLQWLDMPETWTPYVSPLPRLMVSLKVPHAEVEDLAPDALVRTDQKLMSRLPGMQLTSAMVRSGCIHLVVEIICGSISAAKPPAGPVAPTNQPTSAAGLAIPGHILRTMASQINDITPETWLAWLGLPGAAQQGDEMVYQVGGSVRRTRWEQGSWTWVGGPAAASTTNGPPPSILAASQSETLAAAAGVACGSSWTSGAVLLDLQVVLGGCTSAGASIASSLDVHTRLASGPDADEVSFNLLLQSGVEYCELQVVEVQSLTAPGAALSQQLVLAQLRAQLPGSFTPGQALVLELWQGEVLCDSWQLLLMPDSWAGHEAIAEVQLLLHQLFLTPSSSKSQVDFALFKHLQEDQRLQGFTTYHAQPLVRDLALWLQCTHSITLCGDREDMGSCSGARQHPVHLLGRPGGVQVLLSIGGSLLRYAVLQGYAHLAEALLAGLMEAPCHFSFPQLAAMCDAEGRGLLHLAVLSGRLTVVRAVVGWGKRWGCPWSWREEDRQGLSPLHLAALLQDQGRLARQLLGCSQTVRRSWQVRGITAGVSAAQLFLYIHNCTISSSSAPTDSASSSVLRHPTLTRANSQVCIKAGPSGGSEDVASTSEAPATGNLGGTGIVGFPKVGAADSGAALSREEQRPGSDVPVVRVQHLRWTGLGGFVGSEGRRQVHVGRMRQVAPAALMLALLHLMRLSALLGQERLRGLYHLLQMVVMMTPYCAVVWVVVQQHYQHLEVCFVPCSAARALYYMYTAQQTCPHLSVRNTLWTFLDLSTSQLAHQVRTGPALLSNGMLLALRLATCGPHSLPHLVAVHGCAACVAVAWDVYHGSRFKARTD